MSNIGLTKYNISYNNNIIQIGSSQMGQQVVQQEQQEQPVLELEKENQIN